MKSLEADVHTLRRRLQQLLSSNSSDVTQRKECELLLKSKQVELEEARRGQAVSGQLSTGSTRNSIDSFDESEAIRKELFSMQSGVNR